MSCGRQMLLSTVAERSPSYSCTGGERGLGGSVGVGRRSQAFWKLLMATYLEYLRAERSRKVSPERPLAALWGYWKGKAGCTSPPPPLPESLGAAGAKLGRAGGEVDKELLTLLILWALGP